MDPHPAECFLLFPIAGCEDILIREIVIARKRANGSRLAGAFLPFQHEDLIEFGARLAGAPHCRDQHQAPEGAIEW